MAEEMIEAIERYGLSKRNRKRTLFSRIGVVGCGKEGSVIATTAALKGIEVVFFEPNEERIENAYKRIEEKLDKKIQNWGLTLNEKKAILGRIQGTSKYEDFGGCDFVIEAIRYDDNTGERRVVQRKDVFKQLESVLSPKAIIASNVSTVVVTELAAELEHQDRCIGLHFLSNIPDSQIIEIVRGLNTSDETFNKVCLFAKLINHEYVSVVESAGLISIRLFLIQLNEACSMLMEGIATVEDIDRVMTVGFGHRQGVFRTADQMGIEKIVKLLENLYDEYGHVKYKPSPVLLRLSRAKHLGISKNKGFYNYDESGNIIK
ncbi:MAG: 3-hydroxyacyl-CoA dehydrogenase NAD-binding protein [Bacteroidetes bacterium]|jgi:3-hydroxybutyryl-CoA dehydrogenase|nr:3-hydroxyacyl-CoA dehydrogenase NAD-binding protein [Bacteroidota bacterium]